MVVLEYTRLLSHHYGTVPKLLTNSLHCFRLKPQNTEKVLQEYGNRARKLEGKKMGLDDFAHYLDVPVSDMLQDMFSLFDEVRMDNMFSVAATIIKICPRFSFDNFTVLCGCY